MSYSLSDPVIQWLLDLRRVLIEESGSGPMFISIGSVHKGAVAAVSAHPEDTRQETIELIDSMFGAMSVAYVFTIEETLAEDHGVDRHSVWREALSDSEQRLLRAMRHLRHTAGHGYLGSRAISGRTEFDDLADDLRSAWVRFTDTHIVFSAPAGLTVVGVLSDFTQKAISRLASDGPTSEG